jgi:hypothetical protein
MLNRRTDAPNKGLLFVSQGVVYESASAGQQPGAFSAPSATQATYFQAQDRDLCTSRR